MRARVYYYGDWGRQVNVIVNVPDPFNVFWERRAEREACVTLGYKPNAMMFIEVDQNPLHYNCTQCEATREVRCTKRGTVLGFFHDARLIEAGVKKPPASHWPSYFVRGSKHNWHRRHETAGSQFNRKRKNRQERHKVKQELHNV